MKIPITTVLIMGVMVTFGMVLGLLFHLPNVSLPYPELKGRLAYIQRNMRSVGDEKDYVLKSNIIDDLENIRNTGGKKTELIFRQNIRHDSLDSKVNNENNAKQTGKIDDQQLNLSDKQIWRVKQAKIATLHSDYNSIATEQAARISRENAGTELQPKSSDIVQPNINRINQLDLNNIAQAQKILENNEKINNVTEGSNRNSMNLFNSNMATGTGIISQSEFTSLHDIVNGVYWTPNLETYVPIFSEENLQGWTDFAKDAKIVKMEEGCGRMQNRLVTFQDASKACVRYRINTDQIQGDFFSFLLSLLLGIGNIPPAVLSQANIKTPQWKRVSPDILGAQWSEEKILILTQYIPELTNAYIPKDFRDYNLYPSEKLTNKTLEELTELVQWSDLIIFDYLTANLDRVVNNMFNLQWNSKIMDGPVHNLEKSSQDGKLIFLDNESGLFHSYRLLDKYHSYHEKLLKSLCIFRKSTADKITQYYKQQNLGKILMELLQKREPELYRWLPKIPERNVQTLHTRLKDVCDQIQSCEEKYGNGEESTA